MNELCSNAFHFKEIKKNVKRSDEWLTEIIIRFQIFELFITIVS